MTTLDHSTTAPSNYDSVAKAIHWTMALLIPADWVIAIIREDMSREVRNTLMFTHRSIGLLVMALLVIRIAWRLTHTAPAHEKTSFEPWAGLAAKAGHGLLYLLMIAVPLAGILNTLYGGRALPFFGLFEIASPFAQNKDLAKQIGGAHELLANLLMIVVLAHAVAGIFHHVVLKDRTLMKMRPFARS